MAYRFVNDSINPGFSFSGKQNSYNTLYGKLGNLTQYKNSIYKNIFRDLFGDVIKLVDNYSKGNFEEVSNQLPRDRYEKLSRKLYTFPTNGSTELNNLRTVATSLLQGVQQSIFQYIEFMNTIDKLEKCQEKSSILKDRNKLNEYIKQLKNSNYLFDVQPVQVISATLKPEYAEYIKIHGFPEGGIFEADKLAVIQYRLGIIPENNN